MTHALKKRLMYSTSHSTAVESSFAVNVLPAGIREKLM